MVTLGGSLFIHNAITYDYCVLESLASLAALCDEVVIVDAESDDGTTEMLRKAVGKYSNARLVEGVKWECAENYERLSMLANRAIGELSTDWHFMIQADEVLHEDSFIFIREAIESAKPRIQVFLCRRYNLFGSVDHHIRFDLPPSDKPCSDRIIRLGRREIQAISDAESLASPLLDMSYLDKIKIFHYGFVRKDEESMRKMVEMQSWFHGSHSIPDQRIVSMQKGGIFIPEKFLPWDKLKKMIVPHPKFSKKWAEERRR